jgi:cell division protein FtsB
MGLFTARSFWLPVLLSTLVAAFFGALLARRGRELERALAEEARLEAELRGLEEQTARARTQRDALLSSPEAIERVAREEYGFAAPGEQVTVFPTGGARPPARRPAVAGRSAWDRLLMWRQLPLVVPLAVFLLAALVVAAANASAGEDAPPP